MTLSRTQTGPSTRPQSVKAFYVDPSQVSEEGWQKLAGFLEPAVRRQTDYTMQTLLTSVAESRAQVWAIIDDESDEAVGAVTTSIVTYPSGLVGCEIVAGATRGTQVSWESMRDVVATIEQFAQDQGADVLKILGRPGWQRVFQDFDLDYVCITKRIREMAS